MADKETVFVSLDWSYGVNVNGRTVYFGPGERVPVPKAVAEAKGWKLRGQAVEVRAQTLRTLTTGSTLPVELATDKASVSHLTTPLVDAGFVTAESIRAASIDQLTAVDGIGDKTAVKLKAAAEELLS